MTVKGVKKSRGHKNNNPFNLIKSANKWIGKLENSTDKRFEQFKSIDYGIRAGFMNLLSYRKKGLYTVSDIISRYSPVADPENAEGSTSAYIKFVSEKLGVNPHDTIVNSHWRNLGWFMMKYENGYEVVTREYYEFILNQNNLV